MSEWLVGEAGVGEGDWIVGRSQFAAGPWQLWWLGSGYLGGRQSRQPLRLRSLTTLCSSGADVLLILHCAGMTTLLCL